MRAKGHMMNQPLETRPTLRAWIDEYASIENEYLDAFRSRGVAFERRNAELREIARLKDDLRARGIRFRNGDASICRGPLSSACVACTGDCGSKTFFLSLACNRHCYFCFNSNQSEFNERKTLNEAWRDEVDEYFASIGGPQNATHIGLTGGEPLLHADAAIEFIEYVHKVAPQARIRLYTAGDYLSEDMLVRLCDAGLFELRLSVKLDVLDDPCASQQAIDEAVSRIELAARYIPQAMVEMPAITGTVESMRRLLVRLDEVGAFGINLLEFGYPLNDWASFANRGFAVKNPPFSVIYNWGYAGGLPIAGSEAMCLRLLRFADEKDLRLGVHYCSLENKNRDQVITQNRAYIPDSRVYEQDGDSFYYVTLKFFDDDRGVVRSALCSAGLSSNAIQQDDCLLVHPRCIGVLASMPVVIARSLNVVERRGESIALREVKLECMEEGTVKDSEDWAATATAWEFAAFSFRYPTQEHIEALASGQWADAANEILDALGMAEPDSLAGLACDASEWARGEGAFDALRTEATRLFIGAPHAACSPYEGQWRQTGEGRALLFVNKYALEVERFCKECGYTHPAGTNEPLDHVSTECELMELLALRAAGYEEGGEEFAAAISQKDAARFFGRFASEHILMWAHQFAEGLRQATDFPYYKAAACFLDALASYEQANTAKSES